MEVFRFSAAFKRLVLVFSLKKAKFKLNFCHRQILLLRSVDAVPFRENPFFPVGNSRFRQGEFPFPSRDTAIPLRRNSRFQVEKREFPKTEFQRKL